MQEEFFIEKTIQKVISERRAEFDGTDEDFDKFLEKKLPKIVKKLLQGVWEALYDYCFDEKNDLRNHQKKINASIHEKYGNGLKLVESFIEMNSQVSISTYEKYRKIFDTFEDQLKHDTLI